VIVGRSGSGKSVLLKLMMGLIKPDRGKVVLFGRDLAEVSPVEMLDLRKRMGMLFQNYALFDSLPVLENVAFTLLENTDLPRRDVLNLARELIKTLGLEGSESLLPAELSGGMKKRVSLGRALLPRPEVVLFDEPTTGLDPIMIEKVDEMILLARQQFQITSVIISHDMASTQRLPTGSPTSTTGRSSFPAPTPSSSPARCRRCAPSSRGRRPHGWAASRTTSRRPPPSR
jgi:ABC-type transporter Mla maintaining outer membrane lipid asymmetry ATPase subunit MlaF